MTTYYISSAGSDSNNGLGPDASHASNKPWLTLGKALASGSPMTPGDTAHVGPGIIYQGGGITVISGITSVGSPTAIRGDPLNAQGFKDGSGVLLPPAPAVVTTRTSGDGLDGPITSTAALLSFQTNDPNGLQFYDLFLECSMAAAGAAIVLADMNGSTDILLERCRLAGFAAWSWSSNVAATAGRNITLRQCEMYVGAVLVASSTAAAATADADLNFLCEDCIIHGRLTANLALSASGGNLAGGIRFKYCYNENGSGICITTTALRVSTTTPISLEGCVFVGSSFTANTSGHIVDNGYCRYVMPPFADTNFTIAGTSKKNTIAEFNDAMLWRWGLVLPVEDAGGWSPFAPSAVLASGATRTSPDIRGRTARPWGAGPTLGPWEVATLEKDTTSAITGGGANSGKLTGAGELSFYVPVDAESTTITVKTKSANYGGTNYPQMIVMPNPALGVTQQTATATDGSEQTLTCGAFTPTAAGVVEVRLISRSSSVSSATNFDVLAKA